MRPLRAGGGGIVTTLYGDGNDGVASQLSCSETRWVAMGTEYHETEELWIIKSVACIGTGGRQLRSSSDTDEE